MSASLGTISFITLKGQLQRPGTETEDISREGTNGNAFRIRQSRATPSQVIGIRDCDSLADANNKYLTLLALKGSVVSGTGDNGVTHPRVMVRDVELIDSFKIATGVGGVSTSHGAMLVVRLDLQVLP